MVYLGEKAVSGYSSSQAPAVMVHDHGGWHSSGHLSSKAHSYGASMPSVGQWSSRSPAAVVARSDWSGRSGISASFVGVGSSFMSSAKYMMGMGSETARGVTSLRTSVEARYGAYKSMTNVAARRY